jgi:predicted transcriptional regulator
VRELERQGLGKKVIADMFGLALRSYRQKVQRLRESVTSRGVTLWGAVHAFLAERGSSTRLEILAHFKHDDEATVRGILNDLVESGLVHRTGHGRETRYRVATQEELEELGTSAEVNSEQTNEAVVWVHICRSGPMRKEQLAEVLPLPEGVIEQALARLVADDRVRIDAKADGLWYATDRCLIPVGESAGWEAALIDHHRAVLTALAAKVVSGKHASAAGDEVGGTTLSYDLWPGHPKEQEVRQLLASTRAKVIALWDEVEEHNKNHPSDVTYQVTYYCGQYLVREDDEA